MNDEQAMVAQVLAGDVQAFKTLVRQHQRLVSHMVGRVVKNESDLEELCQDVFLKVYDRLRDFRFQSRLSTWIATIAYRHAINHARKARIQFADFSEEHAAGGHFVEQRHPGEMMEDADVDQVVMKLVEQLPPQYQLILTMYHVEGMTYPEICAVTQMPEGTVKNYLFRARRLLKEKLSSYLGKEESDVKHG